MNEVKQKECKRDFSRLHSYFFKRTFSSDLMLQGHGGLMTFGLLGWLAET